MLRDFHAAPRPAFTPRALALPLDTHKITSIIGARRSGKTYLLYQLVDRLLKQGVPLERIFFLNFEDERLDLEARDLDLLLQAYQELYPGLKLAACYFLFDEIQNVVGWERFVRRLYEQISRNIYITGSNARLLSSDIATALRGRALSRTVYPFSFPEVLNFRGITIDLHGSSSRTRIESALDEYLEQGGFPEVLALDEPYLKVETLQSYFDVMLLKDLADRYRFTNTLALRYFLKRLAASATKQISVHAIYNELKSAGIRIGKSALYDFLQGSEDIFLTRTLPKYSPKVSTRELGEKKVYFIDNGLLNAIRFRFTDDRGKAMEQVVYWHLMRTKNRQSELFYYKNRHECDFLVQDPDGMRAVQVCYSLEDPGTRQREIKGLVHTCKALGLESGTIITRAEVDEMLVANIRIRVIPLATELLSSTVQ